jgi:hypothetical protein
MSTTSDMKKHFFALQINIFDEIVIALSIYEKDLILRHVGVHLQ